MTDELWYILLILIPVACLVFFLAVDNYYLRRRARRLQKRVEYLRDGNDLMNKRGFAPAECADSHLAGDCPLCGAV